MIAEALNDRSFEIPNQWATSLEFSDPITFTTLSFHGFMLAVGFQNGKLILSDSEIGTNRYCSSDHKTSITSLSFSRHSHFIASADSSGYLQIKRILSGEILFSQIYDSPIAFVSFHWQTVSTLLVLEANHSLSILNIFSGERRFIEGEFLTPVGIHFCRSFSPQIPKKIF